MRLLSAANAHAKCHGRLSVSQQCLHRRKVVLLPNQVSLVATRRGARRPAASPSGPGHLELTWPHCTSVYIYACDTALVAMNGSIPTPHRTVKHRAEANTCTYNYSIRKARYCLYNGLAIGTACPRVTRSPSQAGISMAMRPGRRAPALCWRYQWCCTVMVTSVNGLAPCRGAGAARATPLFLVPWQQLCQQPNIQQAA